MWRMTCAGQSGRNCGCTRRMKGRWRIAGRHRHSGVWRPGGHRGCVMRWGNLVLRIPLSVLHIRRHDLIMRIIVAGPRLHLHRLRCMRRHACRRYAVRRSHSRTRHCSRRWTGCSRLTSRSPVRIHATHCPIGHRLSRIHWRPRHSTRIDVRPILLRSEPGNKG